MPSSQIFLFTGENAYQLRAEKLTWKREFEKKHGDQNLLTLPASGLTFRLLLDEVSTAPFLGEKRLVMIDGVPTFTGEEIERLPEMMHPATLLVFVAASPDKRLSAVKALLKTATIKECAPLTGAALKTWLLSVAQASHCTLEPAAVTLLLSTIGEDQDALAQELEKLRLFATGRSITEADVQRMTIPSNEQEIWQLTNLLARGDTQGVLAYAESLLQRGEDAYSLWSIVLWFLRQTVLVWACVQEGDSNPATITSRVKVPFPSVRTILPAVRNVRKETLKDLIDRAVRFDIELKTGGFKATGEFPEEVQALLTSILLRSSMLFAGR